MDSTKMALDALTAALDAMEHMANTLNNMDAVDEDEDAQHDAAFEAVRLAIAQLEQPQKSRIVAASMNSYPEADQRFFNFWYGHMFEDLMQPPLVGIDHATARYIWNAAEGDAIAALQAEPQPDAAFVRNLLWDEHPECCGCPVVGAIYMGEQEMVCCGQPEPALLNDRQIVASLRVKFPALPTPPKD